MQLTITDSAKSKILATAAKEGVDLADTHLRIAVVPGGCSGLTYELGWDTTVRDVDETTELEGIHLVIDRRSRAYIDGSKLHFTEGLEGRGFHFDNPQAVRNCACGESFGL